jgi:PAS domain S-box-containing protein
MRTTRRPTFVYLVWLALITATPLALVVCLEITGAPRLVQASAPVNTHVVLALATFAASTLGVFAFARKLARPIAQLARDTKAHRVGVPIAVSATATAEVSEVASAFNEVMGESERNAGQLQDALEQNRAIFEHAPLAMLRMTPEGDIAQMNPAAELLLGWTPAECVGVKRLEHIFISRDHHRSSSSNSGFPVRLFEAVADRISGTAAAAAERTCLCKDGTQIPVTLAVSALRHARGDIVGYIAIAQDMSLREQVEEERRIIERRVSELQKFESLGLMAGGVAHDFNNILGLIVGNSEIIRHKIAVGETAEKQLSDIEHGAMKAAELCRQMLAFSGRGAGPFRIHDLNKLLDDTTRLLKKHTQSVEMHFDLSARPVLISGDSAQLTQVIMNMVVNAAQAMNGRRGNIWLKTSHTETRVRLEVRDDGCGMTPETKAKIFEPFGCGWDNADAQWRD